MADSHGKENIIITAAVAHRGERLGIENGSIKKREKEWQGALGKNNPSLSSNDNSNDNSE